MARPEVVRLGANAHAFEPSSISPSPSHTQYDHSPQDDDAPSDPSPPSAATCCASPRNRRRKRLAPPKPGPATSRAATSCPVKFGSAHSGTRSGFIRM